MAKKVTTIPASISKYNKVSITEIKKRRVAGYARVSTDSEEQQTSYDAQLDYYTNYIKSRDALLQKTYTVDVLTKKRVSNNGIVPQYYVENNHEVIIPRQLFMQVQEELLRRAHLKIENGKTKRVYSSKYALSSIIYCGKCGDIFRRVAWKARGASYNKWRCAER